MLGSFGFQDYENMLISSTSSLVMANAENCTGAEGYFNTTGGVPLDNVTTYNVDGLTVAGQIYNQSICMIEVDRHTLCPIAN